MKLAVCRCSLILVVLFRDPTGPSLKGILLPDLSRWTGVACGATHLSGTASIHLEKSGRIDISTDQIFGVRGLMSQLTLWLFNIAMENCQFIDGWPIKNADFPWPCKRLPGRVWGFRSPCLESPLKTSVGFPWICWFGAENWDLTPLTVTVSWGTYDSPC